MAPAGSLAFSAILNGPDHHTATLAVQPLASLEMLLHRSVRAPAGPRPGSLSFKLRLQEETARRPAIAIGASGLGGDSAGSGEYLVFSKRVESFDLTGGFGWGRYAGDSHWPNPFYPLGRRFRTPRSLKESLTSPKRHWLAGTQAGVFAGVEYFTPLPGLSTTLEYSTAVPTLTTSPSAHSLPFSLGVTWRVVPGVDLGAGWERGERWMLRLTAGTSLTALPASAPPPPLPPSLAQPLTRPTTPLPPTAQLRAVRTAGLPAEALAVDRLSATLWLSDLAPDGASGRDIGRAARAVAQMVPDTVEEIAIIPAQQGVRGQRIALMRSDLERAAQHRGSPAEIAGNLRFDEPPPLPPLFPDHDTPTLPPPPRPGQTSRQPGQSGQPGEGSPAAAAAGRGLATYRRPVLRFTVLPRLDSNLAQPEDRWRLRSSLSLGITLEPGLGLLAGGLLRLHGLDTLGPSVTAPNARGRVSAEPRNLARDARYAHAAPVTPERLYLGWQGSLSSEWHVRGEIGALEEQYRGYGGEILYRPAASLWALGGSLHRVAPRQPGLSLAPQGRSRLTGHASLYRESPDGALQGALHVGRYLAGDLGATLELGHRFRNGLHLGGGLTWSGGGRLAPGLRLSLPLGGWSALPDDSRAIVTAAPLGSRHGQRLDMPARLYDRTSALSPARIRGTWRQVME